MKNLRFMVCLVALTTGLCMSAVAQNKVVPAQVAAIIASGNFNSGGSTSQATYTAINTTNYPCLYTKLDSVQLNVPDTFYAKLIGEYNSTGFGFDVAKIAGRTDSFTIKVYGTKKPSPAVGDYKLLTTLTVGNASTYLDYDINAGIGNPYTKYMLVFSTTNAATGSNASWRGWLLTR